MALQRLFTDSRLRLDAGDHGYAVHELQVALRRYADRVAQPAWNPGVADGAWGARMTTAVNAWKTANGRAANSKLLASDAAVLLRLMQTARLPIAQASGSRADLWITNAGVWRAYLAGLPANDPIRRAAGLSGSPRTSSPTTPRTGTSSGSRVLTGAFVNGSGTLRSGVCGEQVRVWQSHLGHMVPTAARGIAAGTFDAATEVATKAAQRAMGLPADGIVGPQTRTAFRAYCVRRGYSFSGTAGAALAPCASGSTPAPSGGDSSGGGGGALPPDASTPPAGLGGGLLDKISEYGPVLAIGLGVAAFAMLGGGGSRRR